MNDSFDWLRRYVFKNELITNLYWVSHTDDVLKLASRISNDSY